MLQRNCPKCNSTLTYKSPTSFKRQVIQECWCRSCAYLKKRNENKIHQLEKLLQESNEAYYWVGFIFADGYISNKYRLVIRLSNKDLTILIDFCNFINFDKKLISVKEKYCSVSIMDTNVVKLLIRKFSFHIKKTYNPPNLNIILKNTIPELIYSFITGYIDGDGNIKHQYKRQDFLLSVKVHSSWLDNLHFMGKYIGEHSKVRINKFGYALLINSHSQDLIILKNKILSLNIPHLNRKWQIINLNYESKYIKSKIKQEQLTILLNQNKTRKEICEILKVSQSWISTIIKKNEQLLLSRHTL